MATSKIEMQTGGTYAQASRVIDYGTNTSIKPSRNGWLVARGVNTETQTSQPIVRIKANGNIIAEGVGLTPNDSWTHATAAVKGGETYTIEVFRCQLSNVKLF